MYIFFRMLKYRLKTKQKNYFKVIFHANYKIPERSVDRLRLCPIPATAGTPITFSAKSRHGFADAIGKDLYKHHWIYGVSSAAGTPITFSAKKQKRQCILTETKKTDYSLSFEPVANLNRKPI